MILRLCQELELEFPQYTSFGCKQTRGQEFTYFYYYTFFLLENFSVMLFSKILKKIQLHNFFIFNSFYFIFLNHCMTFRSILVTFIWVMTVGFGIPVINTILNPLSQFCFNQAPDFMSPETIFVPDSSEPINFCPFSKHNCCFKYN